MKRNAIVLIGGLVLASEIIWHVYKIIIRGSRDKRVTTRAENAREGQTSDAEVIAEVMFFSKNSTLCRSHANNTETCPKPNCAVKRFRKLIGYVGCAKESLDVCMYAFTCQPLLETILTAHKRGVLVRAIVDYRMAQTDTRQVGLLYESGVAVRMQPLDVLMHHKFVIVDGKIVISGSSNWTMTAFFGNFENVLVTNQLSLVAPFVEEFEKLWFTFDPSTNSSNLTLKSECEGVLTSKATRDTM